MTAQQYVFHAYQQDDGLKNLVVKGLTVGRAGLMWIGTENGIYRFLGSDFERYDLEEGAVDNDIQDLYSDPDGTIWAGTHENLYRFEGQKFVPAGANPIHILGSRRITAENAGHLLVVDKNRLYRLEHGAQQQMISYTPVFSDRMLATFPGLGRISSINIVEDRSGAETGRQTVWVGCGQKLCFWPEDRNGGPSGKRPEEIEGSLQVWGADKGLAEDTWVTVLVDHEGTVWVAGQHRVAALPRGATRFIDRTVPDADHDGVYIQAPLVEDREGRILVASEDKIERWDGKAWQPIGQDNGLPSGGHITSLIFDASGDLWIGNGGSGLNHWVGYEDWEGWDDIRGLPSAEIWSILPFRQDRLLLGTQKGPAWVDPRTGSAGPLFAARQWAFGQVGTMGLNRDGSLWATTFSGSILRIDPKTGQVAQTAKLPALILNGLGDSAGDTFFATTEGIYARDAAAPMAPPHPVAAVNALFGASARFEASCAAPDGSLWFLGMNRILREVNGQWTAPPIDGLAKLRGSLIALTCGADGSLWVTGPQSGVWRLTYAEGHLHAGQLELPSEYRLLAPLAILTDGRGWVWLGTDQGLMVWNGQSWRHLTQESGLIWNDVNQGMLRSGPDGSLWVGTTGGLSHLMHPEHVFNPVPLTILITGVRRGDQNYSAAQNIVLPWDSAPLRFRLSLSSVRNRSESFFQYRMEGLQTDWIDTRSPVMLYQALPPGEYTFMAKIRNPDMNAASDLVKLQVQILPPWWRSHWFYALCTLAFLLLLILGANLRDRNLRHQSKQLERLVNERTQELELSREQLRIQATHDGLTGMLNRVAVLRVLTAEMDRARREDRTLVVALVDLDHFKHINDIYGHLAGDEALRWFAAAVGAAIRAYDQAGRYGGEEFLLVLTEIPPQAAEQRLASLHASISNLHVHVRGLEFTMACSIGATIYDPAYAFATVESLLAIADKALYAAKDAGRNRAILYEAHSKNLGREDLPKR
jgi:diguanylate cyclase (GGDEF)-like protein